MTGPERTRSGDLARRWAELKDRIATILDDPDDDTAPTVDGPPSATPRSAR